MLKYRCGVKLIATMQSSCHVSCFLYNSNKCTRFQSIRRCNYSKFGNYNYSIGLSSLSDYIKNYSNYKSIVSNCELNIFGRFIINYNIFGRSIIGWYNSSRLVGDINIKILRNCHIKISNRNHTSIHQHPNWSVQHLIYN